MSILGQGQGHGRIRTPNHARDRGRDCRRDHRHDRIPGRDQRHNQTPGLDQRLDRNGTRDGSHDLNGAPDQPDQPDQPDPPDQPGRPNTWQIPGRTLGPPGGQTPGASGPADLASGLHGRQVESPVGESAAGSGFPPSAPPADVACRRRDRLRASRLGCRGASATCSCEGPPPRRERPRGYSRSARVVPRSNPVDQPGAPHAGACLRPYNRLFLWQLRHPPLGRRPSRPSTPRSSYASSFHLLAANPSGSIPLQSVGSVVGFLSGRPVAREIAPPWDVGVGRPRHLPLHSTGLTQRLPESSGFSVRTASTGRPCLSGWPGVVTAPAATLAEISQGHGAARQTQSFETTSVINAHPQPIVERGGAREGVRTRGGAREEVRTRGGAREEEAAYPTCRTRPHGRMLPFGSQPENSMIIGLVAMSVSQPGASRGNGSDSCR